jgi:hypothetical protein
MFAEQTEEKKKITNVKKYCTEKPKFCQNYIARSNLLLSMAILPSFRRTVKHSEEFFSAATFGTFLKIFF